MNQQLKLALRKHKVDLNHAQILIKMADTMLKGYTVTTTIDEYDHPELTAVHLTYLIPISAKQAVDMFMDYIDLFLSKGLVFPSEFHIGFSGTQE